MALARGKLNIGRHPFNQHFWKFRSKTQWFGSVRSNRKSFEKTGPPLCRVSRDEVKPDQVWYLPHFPVLRPDKSTTKTRIVFDASAKFNDLSLNDIVLQEPKLQSDLFAVLLRFRRDPVALMCDIKGRTGWNFG